MKKSSRIIVSVVLIFAALLVKISFENFQPDVDPEVVGFFAGLFFGTGMALAVSVLFRKRKSR